MRRNVPKTNRDTAGEPHSPHPPCVARRSGESRWGPLYVCGACGWLMPIAYVISITAGGHRDCTGGPVKVLGTRKPNQHGRSVQWRKCSCLLAGGKTAGSQKGDGTKDCIQTPFLLSRIKITTKMASGFEKCPEIPPFLWFCAETVCRWLQTKIE